MKIAIALGLIMWLFPIALFLEFGWISGACGIVVEIAGPILWADTFLKEEN